MPTIEKNDGAQSGNKKETDLADAAKQMTDQDIPPESQVQAEGGMQPNNPTCITTMAVKPNA